MAGKIALELTDLPPALSIERAPKLLGLSRSSAYRAAANGQREAPGQEGVCERGDSNPHGLPHRDLNHIRVVPGRPSASR
jgi:hypothetical protein